eukprot:Em0001g2973a
MRILKKGSTGTSEEDGSCILSHQEEEEQPPKPSKPSERSEPAGKVSGSGKKGQKGKKKDDDDGEDVTKAMKELNLGAKTGEEEYQKEGDWTQAIKDEIKYLQEMYQNAYTEPTKEGIGLVSSALGPPGCWRDKGVEVHPLSNRPGQPANIHCWDPIIQAGTSRSQ